MKDNRFELAVMFVGLAMLPTCGAALVVAGLAGKVAPAAGAFFGFISVIGTIMAAIEVHKGLQVRGHYLAIQARRARQKAEEDRIAREGRPGWAQRIAMSNARHEAAASNVRRVDFRHKRRAA